MCTLTVSHDQKKYADTCLFKKNIFLDISLKRLCICCLEILLLKDYASYIVDPALLLNYENTHLLTSPASVFNICNEIKSKSWEQY